MEGLDFSDRPSPAPAVDVEPQPVTNAIVEVVSDTDNGIHVVSLTFT